MTPDDYRDPHKYVRDEWDTTGRCLCGLPAEADLHAAIFAELKAKREIRASERAVIDAARALTDAWDNHAWINGNTDVAWAVRDAVRALDGEAGQ